MLVSALFCTGAQKQGDAPSAGEREEDRLHALRAAIEPAWEQAEQGQVVTWDISAVIRELDEERRVKDRP